MGNYGHFLLMVYLIYFKTNLLLVEHYKLFTNTKSSGKLEQCTQRLLRVV